jgi:F-type H+-transporting ATPase subunit epsilon
MIGETTANKVEISKSGTETEVQGTLDVHGGLDVNEDVTIDLDATDEEIVITQSSVAGTASTPLIFVNDDREVLARFRAELDDERVEHVETTRLHLSAMRHMLARLQPKPRGAGI